MKDEKKAETKKVEAPAPAKVTPPVADTKPTELRSVVSKDASVKLGLKATYATLWQNASGKKGDPNEKDSKGIPVLEKYYRNWVNAD